MLSTLRYACQLLNHEDQAIDLSSRLLAICCFLHRLHEIVLLYCYYMPIGLPVTYRDIKSRVGFQFTISSFGFFRGDIDHHSLFRNASSFQSVQDNHTPAPSPRGLLHCARRAPMTFSRSGPSWLAHQPGQWVARLYTAIIHISLSMSCN